MRVFFRLIPERFGLEMHIVRQHRGGITSVASKNALGPGNDRLAELNEQGLIAPSLRFTRATIDERKERF